MRRGVTCFILGASLLSTPALAIQDNTATPAADGAKPVKPKKICRQDVDTGSIMTVSTCHTREEWAEIDKANQGQGDRALQNLHAPRGMGH
jgi:hypothetical protein